MINWRKKNFQKKNIFFFRNLILFSKKFFEKILKKWMKSKNFKTYSKFFFRIWKILQLPKILNNYFSRKISKNLKISNTLPFPKKVFMIACFIKIAGSLLTFSIIFAYFGQVSWSRVFVVTNANLSKNGKRKNESAAFFVLGEQINTLELHIER